MANEAAFQHYLNCYNARDLAGVLAHLRDDCVVYFGEHELARGKPNLQPTYEQDFAGGSEPVTVVGDIQASGDAIKVSLKNPNMPPNGKIIDVTYFFDNDVLMVKHEIHGVRECS